MLQKFLKEVLSELRRLAEGGLFYIFGSSVIAQMGGLLSSFLVIRNLPKAEYGAYVSANNLYAYLTVFIGMGMTSAVMQFCSEHISEQRKDAIYRYSFLKGSVFNILLAFFILLLSLFKQQTSGAIPAYYLRLMCGLPFFSFVNNYFLTVLRVQRKNREYSRLNVISTIFTVSGNIIFTHLFGIPGLIASCYAANAVVAGFGCIGLRKNGFISAVFSRSQFLPYDVKRTVTKYAVLCAVTNFTSSILVLLDITCLDAVLSSPNILADYKVAAVLPSACGFIPSCLIVYFYPHMVESFSTGIETFKRYFFHLMKIFTLINSVVFIGLIMFAPTIITLIYGEKYANVLPIFKVLCLNYFISASFRKLLGNMIVVVKAVNVNLFHTLLAGGLNIILDLILIQRFGPIGAAVATVCVSMFVTLLELLYFRRFFCRASRSEAQP